MPTTLPEELKIIALRMMATGLPASAVRVQDAADKIARLEHELKDRPVFEEANRSDILEEAACIADKIADAAYSGNLQEWAGREIAKRIRALKSSS